MFLVSKSGDPSGVHLSSSVYKWWTIIYAPLILRLSKNQQ
jgi:hypothetical protein